MGEQVKKLETFSWQASSLIRETRVIFISYSVKSVESKQTGSIVLALMALIIKFPRLPPSPQPN